MMYCSVTVLAAPRPVSPSGPPCLITSFRNLDPHPGTFTEACGIHAGKDGIFLRTPALTLPRCDLPLDDYRCLLTHLLAAPLAP